MRSRMVFSGIALLAATAAGGATAAAQTDFFVQGAVSTQGGWTNNVNVAADTEGAEAESSVFGSVSPSVLLAIRRSRMTHLFTYRFGFNRFQDNQTIDHSGSYAGAFAVTPRSELGLGASASVGEVSAVNLNDAVATEGGTVGTLDGQQFVTTGATENFRYELTPQSSLGQSARISRFSTETDGMETGTSWTYGAGLSYDRNWARTVVGGELEVEYLNSSAPEGGAVAGNGDSVISTLRVRMLRDLNVRWSTGGNVGVQYVRLLGDPPTEDAGRSAIVPTLSANATYTTPDGQVSFSVSRAVVPNVLNGTTSVNEDIGVSGGAPIPWIQDMTAPRWRFESRISGFRATQVGFEGQDTEASYGVVCDAAVTWAIRDGMQLDARYQYNKQTAAEGVVDVQPFARHTMTLGFTASYPATQPPRAPRVGGSNRADASDRVPIGDEELPEDAAGAGARPF